ncbi:sulfite exporter TauE/SafE family protein [Gaoshiqia sp. Z1-71]|uniref:sulfite exporter TauE/SafE family protein n=1 Tax=Gaoshiqia hydrogeniformans TaxID=3290090 RepID=UPI003BF8415F
MIFYSPIEPVYFLLPLFGLIIGLFGTMLGGGGGFFFLPILMLLVKAPAQTAVITSLVATLPICLVGSLGHYRKSNINIQMAVLFAISGIAGAFTGAGITRLVSGSMLKVSFGVYSVLIAVNMIAGTWRNRHDGVTTKVQRYSGQEIAKGSFFGLFGGIITGAFGTSGTAPVLAGLFSMRIPLKMVIGTSMLVVLINTFFAVGAHFLIGKIDLTLVGFLTAGSAIGALTGPKLLANVKVGNSENKIKYAYAAVMVALGVLMIAG